MIRHLAARARDWAGVIRREHRDRRATAAHRRRMEALRPRRGTV